MKHQHEKRNAIHSLLCLAVAAGMAIPNVHSAPLVLATSPLANSTTTNVLPNLMFILDNSGSMGWNYLPDWANDALCRNTNGAYNFNCQNQPPFRSSDFNSIYYNPEITYLPAVNADGSSKPSQTSWTSVKNDAYNVQSTGSTNLVTDYYEVEWCTNSDYNDCLRNDNYHLPGIVQGKTYTTARYAYPASTAKFAAGDIGSATVVSRAAGPHYYSIIPGEYCDSLKLVNCQTTKTEKFSHPAKLRWCSDAAMTICQANRTSTYKIPRYPTKYSPSTTTIRVNSGDSTSVSSIKISGVEIMSGATSSSKSSNNIASYIGNKINDCTAVKTGNCTATGYSATVSGSTVTIVAPVALGAITTTPIVFSSGPKTFTTAPFSGYVLVPGSFRRVDIVTGATYAKARTRTDCAATDVCTYAEEMTNFANWWAYYQTRMQAMKTAASHAFKSIDNRYRVGFITIANQSNTGHYLPIAKFNSGTSSQKEKWYSTLFAINPTTTTPLRSALSVVGRIFAGKKPVGSSDPVEYSCQQNFALLTTDGYWNTDSNTDVKGLDDSPVGNVDASPTPRPMFEGATATSNTLADVAKYYYETDLRDSSRGNCTGALGLDVCKNNVFTSSKDANSKQHMTTFTLGLGVDGTLSYASDYESGGSVDFNNLSKSLDWPVPVGDTETAVDDLWHAAVNGRGTYFSAKDPSQLAQGLNSALTSIGTKVGSGAAAATSTLNPVKDDNFAFVASYTTVKWQGNLEARTIGLLDGEVSETAKWCVENVIAGTCSAPGSIVAETIGDSTVYNCVTPVDAADACEGTRDGDNCKVPMKATCTGTMTTKVSASSDGRRILMKGSGGSLVDFTFANLESAGKAAYFTSATVNALSQWSRLGTEQQKDAQGETLVNFLRGQKGYEDRSSNEAKKRLFRYREATLGDTTESQPSYVGKSPFSYTDAGYSSFASATASRAKTVFIGANDGMLHAFDSNTGDERWAYVPSTIIPNLWKLADKNYATMHMNYVNGGPVISDIYNSSVGAWRTILVAGLNGGGRGYYALDVTEPDNPSLLWEIDSTTESNLGYSFGKPVVTKLLDGKWVVLLTSGYNNTSPGDGVGRVFVLNAVTGEIIRTIGTGVGDAASPSGLAKITAWADFPEKNNTAGYVYGGDLLGNVWRFNINTGEKMKLAMLKDPSGAVQPITARPELGLIHGKRVVFVGTGKYLEVSDLTTTQKQSIYAIRDADATVTLDNPRSKLKEIVVKGGDGIRTASVNKDKLPTECCWYADFPDSGERVNIDMYLTGGILLVPTTVPSNTVCEPGGYGWLNYFNYETGEAVAGAEDNIVSQRFSAPIVGTNVYRLSDGTKVTTVVTANQPTPKKPPRKLGNPPGQQGFQGRRAIWREVNP